MYAGEPDSLLPAIARSPGVLQVENCFRTVRGLKGWVAVKRRHLQSAELYIKK